jgi:hypothetical protein
VFVKVFTQILDSTLADDWQARHVFEDLLKLADREGVVDMTPAAISRRIGVPIEIVTRAIAKLSEPDPESRSAAEEGRRIVLLDEHRSWGWRIVNYLEYRAIRDEDARKTYQAEWVRKKRADCRLAVDKTVDTNRQSTKSTHADVDVEVKSIAQNADAFAPGDLTTAKTEKLAGKRAIDEIGRVYDAYPLKKAKGDALKAIKKALERVRARGEADPESFLVRKIGEWTDSRKRDAAAGRFVPELPYPATWFSRESYDDDLSTADAKPKPAIADKPVFEQRSTIIPMADIRARAGIQ